MNGTMKSKTFTSRELAIILRVVEGIKFKVGIVHNLSTVSKIILIRYPSNLHNEYQIIACVCA